MTYSSQASASSSSATSLGESRAPVIAHAGEGESVRAFGNEILFKLTTEQSGGALVVGLATVPAGNAVPPHVQDREDELFIIVEGAYRFWVDGAETDVEPGALVFIPRGVPHKFQVLGEHAGRHWVFSAPGGFDRFYKECAEVFATPGKPDFARLSAINAAYGNRLI
jgi:mannose-6-phosphate isomerase-like protein (cupin superfamily)